MIGAEYGAPFHRLRSWKNSSRVNPASLIKALNKPLPSSRDPQTALQLILEMTENIGYKGLSQPERANMLDTLSLAYHLTGDTTKAIENQKKAITLLPEGPSRLRTELEENLAKFEAALETDGN